MNRSQAITSCFLNLLWCFPSYATDPLTLKNYLNQVIEQNSGIKSSVVSKSGSELRSDEVKLLLTPTVFANLTVSSDSKLQQFVFFGYNQFNTRLFSFGISQLTSYGLLAKLRYDLLYQEYTNPFLLSPGTPVLGSFSPSYAVASPVLELTQNLWSNGFGTLTRASQDENEAKVLASAYNSSFQAKTLLAKAEQAYWKLALTRQVVIFQKEALQRAKKLYEWNQRRARLSLGEKSDTLQAEANLKVRELDLVTAENDENSASRTFNSSRNVDSDRVQEKLLEISSGLIAEIRSPKRALLRDDVKAAQQSSRAALASAEIALQRDLPTLDLNATFSLNGQSGSLPFSNLSDSIPTSFSLNRPSYSLGLKFSTPLDLPLLQSARDGWKKEKVATDLAYDRKIFEQDQEWKDLVQNLNDAKRRLEFSEKLEGIQKIKLGVEKDRLRKGRTTTYQVLAFEQDYLLAQLARVRDQANALSIAAQMKVFGEML